MCVNLLVSKTKQLAVIGFNNTFLVIVHDSEECYIARIGSDKDLNIPSQTLLCTQRYSSSILRNVFGNYLLITEDLKSVILVSIRNPKFKSRSAKRSSPNTLRSLFKPLC
jgi:hypothetical protein